ncbi:MAG: hypothetical protein ABIH23_26905, partial [bacterium]
MSTAAPTRTTEKVALYRRVFTGLPSAYGTYNPATGRASVVKEPVSDAVILAHLKGKQPYGMFLLVQERTSAVVVDFDEQNVEPVLALAHRSAHYGLPAHIERSKSKGYHVWVFFENGGVPAAKARLVLRHIL